MRSFKNSFVTFTHKGGYCGGITLSSRAGLKNQAVPPGEEGL